MLQRLDRPVLLAHDRRRLGDGEALQEPQDDAFLLLAVELLHAAEQLLIGQARDDGVLRAVGGAVGVALMGAVKTHELDAGRSLESALHAVFVVGLVVCVVALASTLLVPAGRARELARPELRSEPTRVGG